MDPDWAQTLHVVLTRRSEDGVEARLNRESAESATGRRSDRRKFRI